MKRPLERERRPHKGRKDSKSITTESVTSVVYGVLPVLELLRAGVRSTSRILISEHVKQERLAEVNDLARTRAIPIEIVSKQQLAKLTGDDAVHQGVVALTRSAEYSNADEILSHITECSLLLILDGVEDPRNFGAILRTAECSGVDGTFIPEHRSVGLNETVAKASAGASEHVKVAKVTNLNRLIQELKQNNVWVVGTAAEADMDYTQWDWTRPSALVLGNEGKGLHRLVAENCDVLVKIPMYGKIQSLNVSVATGVILFEARRQRELAGLGPK